MGDRGFHSEELSPVLHEWHMKLMSWGMSINKLILREYAKSQIAMSKVNAEHFFNYLADLSKQQFEENLEVVLTWINGKPW